ncbi:DUF1826 domain-containing protein [Gilvimarinus polysaccharolyticus]|uniref:DUF1826 domain-containing protein n=1 Tax=Gilvimarinus polysaccharolyticus TaxID=863921 RepID=UPI0006739227|nr:DUF1826 domain-containing protein [Gilvimarinus polysaccharolyticus]
MQNTAMVSATHFSVSQSTDPAVFTNIYDADINLCVWQRELSKEVTQYSDFLLNQHPYATELRLSGNAKELELELGNNLPAHNQQQSFISNVGLLAEMLTCLLGAKAVGLRLCVASKATCPRFHVDKLGCRLITTYRGKATEWLDNANLDRTKLGRGAKGQDDSKTGLYPNSKIIQQLNFGDVALFKGELWPDNEGRGIIHRSPSLNESERRLFITMDAIT